MSSDLCRASFETWFAPGKSLKRNESGGYELMSAHAAWGAWQAAWNEDKEINERCGYEECCPDHNSPSAELFECILLAISEAHSGTREEGEAIAKAVLAAIPQLAPNDRTAWEKVRKLAYQIQVLNSDDSKPINNWADQIRIIATRKAAGK